MGGNTARSVRAVVIAKLEYRCCPPRVVRGAARQVAIAASVNQSRHSALYQSALISTGKLAGKTDRRHKRKLRNDSRTSTPQHGSLLTLRWREKDSNPRSPVKKNSRVETEAPGGEIPRR